MRKQIREPDPTTRKPDPTTRKSNRHKKEQQKKDSTNLLRTDRKSNRPGQQQSRQLRQQPATTNRPSNRTPTPATAQPVAITITDGPAPARIRSANQYQLGDTVQLHYTTTGTVAHIICRVQQPDGTTAEPSSGQGNAAYQTTQPGQHWYAFDAYDDQGGRLASAEQIFVVAPQHVTRPL